MKKTIHSLRSLAFLSICDDHRIFAQRRIWSMYMFYKVDVNIGSFLFFFRFKLLVGVGIGLCRARDIH